MQVVRRFVFRPEFVEKSSMSSIASWYSVHLLLDPQRDVDQIDRREIDLVISDLLLLA